MSISKKPEICECETTSLHHYDCKKTEKCEECGSSFYLKMIFS